MKRLLALVLLVALFCVNAKGDERATFLIKVSASVYDMIQANDMYFRTFSEEEVTSGEELELGAKSVTSLTRPDIEIRWRTPLSNRSISTHLGIKYQHAAYNISDSTNVIWAWGKHLSADLQFFSAKASCEFSMIVPKPFLSAGIGYCSGTLRTSNNRDSLHNSTEGSGGGVFFTAAIGGSFRIYRSYRLFLEGSILALPDAGWHAFNVNQVSEGDSEISYMKDYDRFVAPQGYQLTLGMEIPIQ